MKRLISAVLLAGTVCVTPAYSAELITHDYGGRLMEYIDKYIHIKSTEGRIKLDGFCISACTLFLGIINPASTCATESSWLAFHSASDGEDHSEEGTKLLGHIYPQKVLERLKKEGFDVVNGQAHPNLIWIAAPEIMPVCNG